MDRERTRMKTDRESTRIDANGSRPVERCLACEAEKGSPPLDRPTLLGALARQALIAEAELTPKPGLVDQRGSGAHTDLSLPLMISSAFAIEPFIRLMAFQSMNERPSPRLRATLVATGRAAETDMLRVTNGSNTHKGAIWTLGLLAAAAAIKQIPAYRFISDAAVIAMTAGEIASFEDSYESTPNPQSHKSHESHKSHSASKPRGARFQMAITGAASKRQTLNAPLSHGQIVAKRFGVTGARGEAVAGFPHIIEVGLPMLRARRSAHAPESTARLDALLAIMAQLDDTCLLYRSGKTALQAAKQGAAAVIAAGGAGTSRGLKRLLTLDKQLLVLGVSPGGSADLLAGTLFLDSIERQPTEIWTDEQELIPIVESLS